jgi:hypothetical protein
MEIYLSHKDLGGGSFGSEMKTYSFRIPMWSLIKVNKAKKTKTSTTYLCGRCSSFATDCRNTAGDWKEKLAL